MFDLSPQVITYTLTIHKPAASSARQPLVLAVQLQRHRLTISFDDLDLSNVSSATAAFVSSSASSGAVSASLDAALSATNTLTLSGDRVDSPAHSGTVNWTFAIDNALVQYLRR